MARLPAVLALLTLAPWTGPAIAQRKAVAPPKAGSVQPDQLPFGVVRTGAIVEGSFQVSVPGKSADIPLAVTAPKGVTVQRSATHKQPHPPGSHVIVGVVEFAVDTAAAADLSGEFGVTLGETAFKVPVTATVKPAQKGQARVLVVETPFDRDSTTRGASFQGWTELVKDAGLDVSYLLVTRGKPVTRDLDLAGYDCVLLAGAGLVDLQGADLKRVRKYAEGGGRVVVAASFFYRGTVERANAVLDGYGLRVRDEESRTPLHKATVGQSALDPAVTGAGVKTASFFRASPVAVTDATAGKVVARASGVGKRGDGFVASAKAGKGEVVAVGQALWWSWVSDDRSAGADNARLLRELLEPRKEK